MPTPTFSIADYLGLSFMLALIGVCVFIMWSNRQHERAWRKVEAEMDERRRLVHRRGL